MNTETITLLFNYGLPTALIAVGLVYGVPYATKKLDQVLDDHRKLVEGLIANNDAQRKQHLEFEQRQRTEYLEALKSTNDKQMQALTELLRLAQDTNSTVEEIRDDFRAWNGIERRRVPPKPNRQP